MDSESLFTNVIDLKLIDANTSTLDFLIDLCDCVVEVGVLLEWKRNFDFKYVCCVKTVATLPL